MINDEFTELLQELLTFSFFLLSLFFPKKFLYLCFQMKKGNKMETVIQHFAFPPATINDVRCDSRRKIFNP